jgi:uroporphyrinogen decarboxylase
MSSTPRDLVAKALDRERPSRIPRQVWLLPWAEIHYPGAVSRLRREFPDDIVTAPALYTRPLRVRGDRYARGIYVDEWGCRFSNSRNGAMGIVQDPLLADWSRLQDVKPPIETLAVDQAQVNAFCRSTDRFVLSPTLARPFERLQFIRTMEQALVDLLEQPPELFVLLERMHDHYRREIEIWAETAVDGIAIMDDWGAQSSLLVSPEIFRRIFKPMYRDYAEIARRAGKRLFMHSDGWITDIIDDLIEVGVEALNAQIFCMGVADLGRRFRGRITFWGEIDRQQLLANGKPGQVAAAVRDVYSHLADDGGVIAQCEFGLEAKPENVFAVFETWDALTADV